MQDDVCVGSYERVSESTAVGHWSENLLWLRNFSGLQMLSSSRLGS